MEQFIDEKEMNLLLCSLHLFTVLKKNEEKRKEIPQLEKLYSEMSPVIKRMMELLTPENLNNLLEQYNHILSLPYYSFLWDENGNRKLEADFLYELK